MQTCGNGSYLTAKHFMQVHLVAACVLYTKSVQSVHNATVTIMTLCFLEYIVRLVWHKPCLAKQACLERHDKDV